MVVCVVVCRSVVLLHGSVCGRVWYCKVICVVVCASVCQCMVVCVVVYGSVL